MSVRIITISEDRIWSYDSSLKWRRKRKKERRHNVMGHVHTFGKSAPAASGIIHYAHVRCLSEENRGSRTGKAAVPDLENYYDEDGRQRESRQDAHAKSLVLAHTARNKEKNKTDPTDLVTGIKATEFFKPIWGELDDVLKPELYIGPSV
ncbi:MAG: hypothetical protein Q9209_005121 [Squamulea sp. 1 TL-2023]